MTGGHERHAGLFENRQFVEKIDNFIMFYFLSSWLAALPADDVHERQDEWQWNTNTWSAAVAAVADGWRGGKRGRARAATRFTVALRRRFVRACVYIRVRVCVHASVHVLVCACAIHGSCVCVRAYGYAVNRSTVVVQRRAHVQRTCSATRGDAIIW